MWTGNVGEVRHAGRHTGRADTVHIREQTLIERDIVEDGAEDSGSLEDEPGEISTPGGADLYEAWSIDEIQKPIICSFNRLGIHHDTEHGHRHTAMNRQQWIASFVIIAVILIGNLGGILWALSW